MSNPPTPYVFSSDAHQHLIPYLAALHGSCITNDRMSGSFLPPLNHEKLLAWWKERIAEVAADKRVIIILLGESEPGTKAKGSELMGVVMLGMPLNETSRHAAFLESLFVSPKMRRRGGARALIAALEYEAVRRGRTLLRVEAETHSQAEAVFLAMGYNEVGKIPGYNVTQSGPPKDQTVFYKILA